MQLGLEQSNADDPRIAKKVFIQREEGSFKTLGRCTKQHVNRRGLNPSCPALIEHLRGTHMVPRPHRLIGELFEIAAHPFKLVFLSNALQKLLPNRPQEDSPAVSQQLTKSKNRVGFSARKVTLAASQRERPHSRIDHHPHRARRAFL